jgi:hypothetical protein
MMALRERIKMPHHMNSSLWPDRTEKFFPDRELQVTKQKGPHCVSTALAIVTSSEPETFQGVVNTQDPASWSDEIRKWGMQLAYCPTDTRRLRHYIPELIEIDDLFVLSYYTASQGDAILKDPDSRGWICGSHIVVLHRDRILDSASGTVSLALEHRSNGFHTSRVFRVVPADYHRRL